MPKFCFYLVSPDGRANLQSHNQLFKSELTHVSPKDSVSSGIQCYQNFSVSERYILNGVRIMYRDLALGRLLSIQICTGRLTPFNTAVLLLFLIPRQTLSNVPVNLEFLEIKMRTTPLIGLINKIYLTLVILPIVSRHTFIGLQKVC